MAEVMKYEDFKEFGNENAVKVEKNENESFFCIKIFIFRLKENIDNKEKIIPLKTGILSILKLMPVLV